MPRVMMTKVIPIAMIPIAATWVTTLSRFWVCRNLPPVAKVSTTTKMMRMPMMAYCLMNAAVSNFDLTSAVVVVAMAIPLRLRLRAQWHPRFRWRAA